MSRLPVLLGLVLLAAAARAESPRWIGTWASSPQPVWEADFIVPLKLPRTLWNQTVRQIARVSIGGPRVRVVLSHAYRARPVTLGAAHAARAARAPAPAAGPARVPPSGGARPGVTPPGAPLLSDPVALPLAPLARVAVSLYLPDATPLATFHFDARQKAYLAEGDKTG